MMRKLLVALAGVALALVGCDSSVGEKPASTVIEVKQDSLIVVPRDTTPKDTVAVLMSRKAPVVDSLVFSWTPKGAASALRSWKILRKDTLVRFPLDTGTGRIWSLKVEGRKNGRLWWTMDSVRVFPDSLRRVVLDSFFKRLVVADTSTPVVVVPVDTNLYIQAAELAGDSVPNAGWERGLFFSYADGRLTMRLVSDGNVPGANYDRVFNAKVGLAFSSAGTIGTASLDDAVYSGKVDNDSVSTMRVTARAGGSIAAVSGNLFARYRLKTLSIPVAKCTVDVAVALRSGVIPTGTPNWVMPSLSDDLAKDFLFLGQGRSHPSRTHFRIVIP